MDVAVIESALNQAVVEIQRARMEAHKGGSSLPARELRGALMGAMDELRDARDALDTFAESTESKEG